MDETIIRSIMDLVKTQVKAVLATIVRTEGSTPREPGTRMLIMENSQTIETIGGGSAEKFILARAASLLNTDGKIQPEIQHLEINRKTDPDLLPVSGGNLDVLLEEVQEQDCWQYAWEMLMRGEEIVLVTGLFPPYPKSIWDSQGNILWGRPEASLFVIAPKFPQIYSRRQALIWGTQEFGWLIDPVLKRERLLILGAGHVGREVANYAKPLDFQVTVLDDRVTYVRPEFFPEAQAVVCSDFIQGIKNYLPKGDTYVVIATWSHRTDEECLKEILNYPVKYVGMLGSVQKVCDILINMQSKGYTAENLARLRGPIGLDIGAQTPAEIALSILAEIVYVRRKESGLKGVG